MLKQLVNRHGVPFALGAISVLFLYGSFLLVNQLEIMQQTEGPSAPPETVAQQPAQTIDVLLETVFADGNTREEHVTEDYYSLEDFWYEYEEWQLVEHGPGAAHFRQEILDLSPEVKRNGYLGLSDQMNVVLYTGQTEAMSIVKTFDDIDVSNLTAAQLDRLNQGMKLTNLAELEQILLELK
ncbi:forespore regulator of the sigma-K checkpoint [Alkalihalobacillus xiaoxiensis]|uniref:Forespore regulator of the sigma-K checkpoint n=1 Tax=Shouchella xiaoxiensis TaxID=766895 RepID=A0ABS2SUR0_9BACI|nr:BofC C-terminal domain-containing protein [Shouchella xiaoxiensis]MBM7837987.1 forespore regulator of the sigma-K checkpoint [Shouchella xiaoxiensis]